MSNLTPNQANSPLIVVGILIIMVITFVLSLMLLKNLATEQRPIENNSTETVWSGGGGFQWVT